MRCPDPGSLLRTFALFIPRLLRWLLFPQSSSVVPVSDAHLNLRLWGQPDMAATLCGLAKGGCVPLPAGHTLSYNGNRTASIQRIYSRKSFGWSLVSSDPPTSGQRNLFISVKFSRQDHHLCSFDPNARVVKA